MSLGVRVWIMTKVFNVSYADFCLFIFVYECIYLINEMEHVTAILTHLMISVSRIKLPTS